LYDQYEKMMTKEANVNPPTVEEFEKAGGAASNPPKEVKLFDAGAKQEAVDAQTA